ncbi:MAG: hypothetical protein JKY56_18705 [Kofleriaceae bacterium]|nr:hypothetical protein [Kofleriaceae bacterium]
MAKSVLWVSVRYLRFSIFLSLIVIATGIFMPFVQVGIGGIGMGGKTALPLYEAMGDLELLESIAARAEASPARRVADALLSRFGRSASQVSEKIADLRSTIQDVQEVRDEVEIDTIRSAIKISSNLFLAALVILAWLVLQSISQRSVHKRRAIFTAVLMTIVGVSSCLLFFGVREGLALANEEIGINILSLASGSYMMLVCGITGTIASVAAAVWESRRAKAPLGHSSGRPARLVE